MSRHRGFTLVELLVVIGIITVLVALLLPLAGAVRTRAVRAACASNLRQAATLLHMYANDNRGEIPAMYRRYPPNLAPPGDPIIGPKVWLGHWVDARYGGLSLLVAPPVGSAKQSYTNSAKVFTCPGDHLYIPDPQNPFDFGRYPDGGPASGYAYLYVPRDGDNYYYDGGVVRERGAYAGFERHNLKQRAASSRSVLHDVHPMPVSEPPDERWTPGFHGDGWNVAYLDGHVAWISTARVHREFYEYWITHPDPVKAPAKATLTVLDRHSGG